MAVYESFPPKIDLLLPFAFRIHGYTETLHAREHNIFLKITAYWLNRSVFILNKCLLEDGDKKTSPKKKVKNQIMVINKYGNSSFNNFFSPSPYKGEFPKS